MFAVYSYVRNVLLTLCVKAVQQYTDACTWVVELQDVAAPLFQASLTSEIVTIVVEVEMSGTPQVLKLWLGVSKGMLNVKYLSYNSFLLYQMYFMEIIRLSPNSSKYDYPHFLWILCIR